jgi:hypothetical protein
MPACGLDGEEDQGVKVVDPALLPSLGRGRKRRIVSAVEARSAGASRPSASAPVRQCSFCKNAGCNVTVCPTKKALGESVNVFRPAGRDTLEARPCIEDLSGASVTEDVPSDVKCMRVEGRELTKEGGAHRVRVVWFAKGGGAYAHGGGGAPTVMLLAKVLTWAGASKKINYLFVAEPTHGYGVGVGNVIMQQ